MQRMAWPRVLISITLLNTNAYQARTYVNATSFSVKARTFLLRASSSSSKGTSLDLSCVFEEGEKSSLLHSAQGKQLPTALASWQTKKRSLLWKRDVKSHCSKTEQLKHCIDLIQRESLLPLFCSARCFEISSFQSRDRELMKSPL